MNTIKSLIYALLMALLIKYSVIEAYNVPTGSMEDTILVGHLPLMSKLTSRLVAGDEEETVVHFKPGAVACLERGKNGGGWTVQWFVRPELLGG